MSTSRLLALLLPMLLAESVVSAGHIMLDGHLPPLAIAALLQANPATDEAIDINDLRIRVLRDLTTVHSGEFKGTWKERNESPVRVNEITSQVHGMFDSVADCYAMQRGKWSPSRGNTPGGQMAYYGTVLAPDQTIRYGEFNRMVTITNRGDQEEIRTVPSGGFVDPRRFATTFYDGVFGEREAPPLEAQIADMLSGEPLSVSREKDGSIRLLWEGESMQHTLWIEERGDAALPIRLTRRVRYPDVDNNAWSPVMEKRDIKWKEAGGVYVPVSVSLERRTEILLDENHIPQSPEERNYNVLTVDLNIEWPRVNTHIALNEFSLDWLNVPEGTGVNDQRITQAPTLTFVGDKFAGREAPLKSDREIGVIRPERSYWPLIVANVALIVFAVAALYWRRTRQNNRSD